jgi:hypothetical protein
MPDAFASLRPDDFTDSRGGSRDWNGGKKSCCPKWSEREWEDMGYLPATLFEFQNSRCNDGNNKVANAVK